VPEGGETYPTNFFDGVQRRERTNFLGDIIGREKEYLMVARNKLYKKPKVGSLFTSLLVCSLIKRSKGGGQLGLSWD